MHLTDGLVRARLLEARECIRDLEAEIVHLERVGDEGVFVVADHLQGSDFVVRGDLQDLTFWRAVERACLSWTRKSGSWRAADGNVSAPKNPLLKSLASDQVTFSYYRPEEEEIRYAYGHRIYHSRRERAEISDDFWHIVPVPPEPWGYCEDAICGSRPTPRYMNGQAVLPTDKRQPKGGYGRCWDETTFRRENTEGHICPECQKKAREMGIGVRSN